MEGVRTLKDIPMIICSPTTSSERRISPSWSISQFKSKMESITGIPPSCQNLLLFLPGHAPVNINGLDESATQLNQWNLQAYAEIKIEDTRPDGLSSVDFSGTEAIQRYTMPTETYENLSDSVLAWKRNNQLGRFNPDGSDSDRRKMEALQNDVLTRKIEVGRRCQIGEDSVRRGKIAYVGEIPEIPGPPILWVGVILDEPIGKNDGSLKGTVYFECDKNRGIFVRPDRVEAGDFDVLGDKNEFSDDMEEL